MNAVNIPSHSQSGAGYLFLNDNGWLHRCLEPHDYWGDMNRFLITKVIRHIT